MKIGEILSVGLLFISLVPYSLQEPSQDTAVVAADQTWQDEYQPEEYRGEKEEETLEEKPTRRPRGKRRRRMRKRMRVHTVDEDVDRISNVGQNQEATFEKSANEEESVTQIDTPRRRPGKRRRRPHRRYQDDDSPPTKPLRRRRKGGRKKIRTEIQDEVLQTDSPLEKKEVYEAETTIQPIITTISNNFSAKLDDENLTEAPIDTVTIETIVNTDQPDIKEDTNNDIKPEISDDKPAGYGSKIFDRKKLFSSPRRTLPVTSAVIRKLGPNRSNYSANSTSQSDSPNNYAANIIDKVLIKSNSLHENNTNAAETIKPERLVHAESKVRTSQKNKPQEVEDEEPNYPKIFPKPLYRSRIKNIETTAVPQITTTEKITTTNEPEKQTESFASQESKMTESEIEKMLEYWDVESFNLTNFDDFIVDLLKSKTGKDRLAKILESRNMTISQLLEHRERGSSKFHLLEMFPQRRKQVKTTEATTAKTTTSTSTAEPSKDSQQIQFPSEDVLGSFQNFSDEIGKHEQKNQILDSNFENTNDSREPRLFESMPEFTTLPVSSTTKSGRHPTWRIIPNPKLRPVSVRGNYEEIPISNVLNKPLENSANDIYIVDERESIIHHKKYGLAGSDRIKSKEPFGNFKKIPVGVKSAIIISGIILAVATFGFLSLLISCRVRQKRTLLRAKQDMMCEQLQNDDFMTSQQSLSPVLTKHQQVYNPHQEHHSHPHNRHYYLWRTIRRTFRYE